MKIYVYVVNPFSGITSFQKSSKPYFAYFWQQSDKSFIVVNNIKFSSKEKSENKDDYYSAFLTKEEFENIKDLVDKDFYNNSLKEFIKGHNNYINTFGCVINETN